VTAQNNSISRDPAEFTARRRAVYVDFAAGSGYPALL